MNISYHKFNPTGNITLIVESPIERPMQSFIAECLMSRVPDSEQVAFIEPAEDADIAVRMMGGEFCGNATMSAALLAAFAGVSSPARVRISGADAPITVKLQRTAEASCSASLSMPLPVSVFDCELITEGGSVILPVVRFNGICHIIVSDELSVADAERYISSWCVQLETDALGIMFVHGGAQLLRPFVYVRGAGSAVWEGSCASGTTAVAAYCAMKVKKSVSVTLSQPGGTLSADAEFVLGALEQITLTGSVEYCGKFEIEI